MISQNDWFFLVILCIKSVLLFISKYPSLQETFYVEIHWVFHIENWKWNSWIVMLKWKQTSKLTFASNFTKILPSLKYLVFNEKKRRESLICSSKVLFILFEGILSNWFNKWSLLFLLFVICLCRSKNIFFSWLSYT